MGKFKVIIAGTRDFEDFELLESYCDHILVNITDEIEIVSGGAKGADRLGERYALKKGYHIKRFPANWQELGKKAGPLRNYNMSEYSDALIAFWNSKSKGTKNMIDVAIKKELKVRVKNI